MMNMEREMKIKKFYGTFSVHSGKIDLVINNKHHDLSSLFPVHNFSHIELDYPEINWEIRSEISKIVRKYVSELDPSFLIENITC